jgi:hypothetical protein
LLLHHPAGPPSKQFENGVANGVWTAQASNQARGKGYEPDVSSCLRSCFLGRDSLRVVDCCAAAAAKCLYTAEEASMQPVRDSYVALIATEALRAWQPSAAVFAATAEPPFTDVTNSTTSSMPSRDTKR